MRFFLALWLAKTARLVMRALKYNGTNYPGELALKLCPDFLARIGKPKTVIAVTGTNGKTTVSNLLCDTLEKAGRRVLNNRLGSNIASGVATSLLAGATCFGKSKYDVAVLEVDERSSLRIYPYVKPDIVVITNLFRDSIMRNAHPEYIAGILTRALPESARLIVNADDLISCRVAPQCARVCFGIERMETDVTECVNLINDMRICPECGGPLEYDYLRYHHIGRARCPRCGFSSPEYDYAAKDVDTRSMTMTVSDKGGEAQYELPSDSVFNIYNMITVVAALRELGFSHGELGGLLAGARIVETRYSEAEAGGVRVVMQMAKDKNALACSRAFDYVTGLPGRKKLLLMMNCLGDEKHWSENVCWLYDCDFEFLTRGGVALVAATGPRALDYKLRLLLAGVPEERIICAKDELEAAGMLEPRSGDDVYIFYGTDSVSVARSVRDKLLRLAKEAAE